MLLSRDHIEGYINISTFIPGIRHISTSANVTGYIEHFIEISIVDKTMHRKLTDDRQLLEELKSALLAESAGMYVSGFHIPHSSSFILRYTNLIQVSLGLSSIGDYMEYVLHRCRDSISIESAAKGPRGDVSVLRSEDKPPGQQDCEGPEMGQFCL